MSSQQPDTTGARQPLLVADEIVKIFPVTRQVRDIVARRPRLGVRALDKVSLSLDSKETLGVVGESGSGKSTLAHCAVGLITPDSGRLLIGGTNVPTAKASELRAVRRRAQLIYQDPYSSLNPRFSVATLISEAPLVHGLVERRDRDKLVGELLTRVGLRPSDGRRRPRELSGGQRQRVAIARALAVQPELLIADEAVSALDVSVQAQILDLLADLRESLGLSVMLISHQLPVISRIADRVAVMYLGQIVESGPVESVFGDPHHPYTIGLLNANPSLSAQRRSRRSPAVQGELPSALNLPSGCRFRTRCPLAVAICAEVEPDSVEVASGHISRCHVLAPAKRLAVGASAVEASH